MRPTVPQTGRIAKVAYTVREILGPASALAHFDDLREVEGIWVPHAMRIGQLGDSADDWFHEMSIERMRFDTFAPDTLEALADVRPLEPLSGRGP